MTSKKSPTKHLSTEHQTPSTPCTNPDQPDAIEEYSILKKEITQRVKAIGIDVKYPVTGDRNYILEADGTLRMRYATVDRATNTWRRVEWAYFTADCKAGLWTKLENLKTK